MASKVAIRAGTRVRLTSSSHTLTLRSDTGTVIGPSPTDEGYVLVRLDQPAIYDNGFRREDLWEIVEAPDNLQALDPVQGVNGRQSAGR
jgi:hypothetical protein